MKKYTGAETGAIKPCPFCGGEAKLHACIELENEQLRALYTGAVGVHCAVCGIATIPMPSEQEAVKTWNKRWKE